MEQNTYTWEQDQRLSQSVLWKLQKAFYVQQGIRAWEAGQIPHYITTNPFVAQCYARVVLGWLRDWPAWGDAASSRPDSRLYIVELGAGTGRFAYQFLRSFDRLLADSPSAGLPWMYVMTDLPEANIEWWRNHAAFAPYIERGVVDFAHFDAEVQGPLVLRESGRTLTQEDVALPMVLFANYFFDSIPQDAFLLRDNTLFEHRVTLRSPHALDVTSGDRELLEDLQSTTTVAPAKPNFYDDPSFNDVLAYYRDTLPTGDFSMPIVGLECLRYFNELSRGRLLVVSADKGTSYQQELLKTSATGIVIHGGGFSMSVNFHALGEYITRKGGAVLRHKEGRAFLEIVAYLTGMHPAGFTETRQAFTSVMEETNPSDIYETRSLLPAGERAKEEIERDLASFLAQLRLNAWDHVLLMNNFDTLILRLSNASQRLRALYVQAIEQVWDAYYYLAEPADVAFRLGMLLAALKDHAKAIDFFRRSLDLYGPRANTHYNLAVCHHRLGQDDDARTYLEQALALSPSMSGALRLRTELGMT